MDFLLKPRNIIVYAEKRCAIKTLHEYISLKQINSQNMYLCRFTAVYFTVYMWLLYILFIRTKPNLIFGVKLSVTENVLLSRVIKFNCWRTVKTMTTSCANTLARNAVFLKLQFTWWRWNLQFKSPSVRRSNVGAMLRA